MEIPLRLPKVLEVRAVIFDIYGTMLISGAGGVGTDGAEDNEDAFRAACLDGGLCSEAMQSARPGAEMLRREIKRDRAVRKKRGVFHPEVDILRIWARTFKKIGLPECSEHQLQRCALSYECRVNPSWPMPGLIETIDGLLHRGLRLGIISNAQFYTPLLFRAFFGKDPPGLGFDEQYCIWSYIEGRGKPDSQLFYRLEAQLAQVSISGSEILYVGNDMCKDVFPAAAREWKTALFAGDRRSLRLGRNDPRLRTIQPDYVINDLRQLLV